jgi:glutathione S-transferase
MEVLSMDLYFAPLACSLATRIALYEAGVDARYKRVDLRAKRVCDGSDFFAVTPMGQVPALRTDDGFVLTENTAVLQHVADAFPEAQLAPRGGAERARLQQWLGFIGTELHKAVFVPLLDPKAPAEVKAYARDKAALRLHVVARHVAGREFLLDRFGIADAYLVTVLNWAPYCAIDLDPWPELVAYRDRLLKRASVGAALEEERAMFIEELARQSAN